MPRAILRTPSGGSMVQEHSLHTNYLGFTDIRNQELISKHGAR